MAQTGRILNDDSARPRPTLDGSKLAETALPVARQVIKANGHITIVTALTSSHISSYEDLDALPETDATFLESTLPRAKEYMEHVAKDLKLRGFEVDVEIVPGHPADVILRLAELRHAEMIIMSTHGRSGLSRVLFGSITLKVLGEAHVPVLVVPNRQREEVPDHETHLGPSLAT